MIKKIIITILMISCVNTTVFAASTTANSPSLRNAIQKYKQGNYTGCLSDLENYTRKDKTNALAYYYYAMTLVKVGNSTKAPANYQRVIALAPNTTLADYAQKGLVCVNTPESCYKNIKVETKSQTSSALDNFINSPYKDGLSKDLRRELQKKQLEKLRKDINGENPINPYDFEKFPQYGKKKSENTGNVETITKIASNTQPTNDEIVAALRTLQAAGLANTTPMVATNQYNPMQAQMTNPMNELSMLLGNNQQQQNNNNNIMNMLPYLLTQQNSSQQNGQQPNNISPQALQAIMFSSMMPDMSFGLSNDKDR